MNPPDPQSQIQQLLLRWQRAGCTSVSRLPVATQDSSAVMNTHETLPEPVAFATPSLVQPSPVVSMVNPSSGPATVVFPVPMPQAALFQDVPTGAEIPPDVPGRRLALEQLAREVQTCAKCPELYTTRTQTVFGVGPPDAEIVFIGEGPGGEEDRLGQPFVGPSGQLLDKMILAMGLKRDVCYIMNVVKCRPPGNRQPESRECLNCRPFFDRQLELLSPRVIICLGAVAAHNLLQTTIGIMKLRGQWQQYGLIPVMPTYHPAALLRNPAWKKDAWDDLKAVLRRLGKPIPGAN